MSERELLIARGLSKSYAAGATKIDVLQGLDLTVARGEAVAVIGDSGVGKSTLLHLLGGLDRPDAGRVVYGDLDVFAADPGRLAAYRNSSVGFVFQFHHLLPEFTALENVMMPARIGRRGAGAALEARMLLGRLGLGDRLGNRPSELSGGEQQRVAVARALANGAELVLADEPTGNLDPRTGGQVFALLRELQTERFFSLVLATHSERLAASCDRVLRLEDGRLRQLGTSETRSFFDSFGS
jgi:lipoprotein-releasing system ATP-binding protein